MTPNPTNWAPYCGSAPQPGELLAQWNFDPLVLIVAGMSLWWGCRAAPSRIGSHLAATALFLFLFVSPFCALGSAFFTARVVHHLLLALVLAPLLVSSLALHNRKIAVSLALMTGIQAIVFWAWHAPPLYAAALSSDAVFWLMQASITATAAIWWARVRQVNVAAAVAALLATMVQMGVLGALITFAGRPLYAPHWLTTQAWGLSPVEDQQIAGLIMWAPAAAAYLLVALAVLYRAIGSPRIEARL